jgi:hypothetical protein
MPLSAALSLCRSAVECPAVFATCLLFLVALGGLTWGPVLAQETEAEIISREYRIKAAFLYRIGCYVEWPPDAFRTPKSPFVIGVFSNNAITPNLFEIAQKQKIHDRTIEVQQCTATSNFADFQILFLPANLDPKIQAEVIQRTAEMKILLVGEGRSFISGGGGISFVIEENNVRLYIARKVIEHQGLTISAKLLQVGHVVD